MEELPETVAELINLQTLEIKDSRLKRLPQGTGKLVNLRHLILEDVFLDYMPKGIERLTCLRTLTELVLVSSSGKYDSKACKLESLRQLNHLRGSLRIRRLGNVTNIDEAKNAHLERKKNLVRLELWFDKEFEEEEEAKSDDTIVSFHSDEEEQEEEEEEEEEADQASHEAISEAFRPPPNLEVLEVHFYEGKTLLLGWIESLKRLKCLSLGNCHKCKVMPPLGKLPSLEKLKIFGMTRVKRIGDEFLEIESDHIHATSSASGSAVIAFPKLKHLYLKSSSRLEEWDFGNGDNITIMPQLNSLEIIDCRKLKSLPDQLLRSETLEKLDISWCGILEERFRKDTGEDWSKISRIPNVNIGQ